MLTAASTRLLEQGYEALTMEGLVADTGVAKRTLYRWWPSKAAVVAEAILGGFLDVPRNPVPRTGDVWSDLRRWLTVASTAIDGPYGEVLRASSIIGATDPALGARLTQEFGRPTWSDLRVRLEDAVQDEQIAPGSDLDAAIDLLMAIIVHVGLTRGDTARIPAAVETLRTGLSPRADPWSSPAPGSR